jgi:D-tyrosyl-tRNA(Tyr) deacylase
METNLETPRPAHCERVAGGHFCETLRGLSVPVQTGVFGAHMQVELVNDGPVTVILDA